MDINQVLAGLDKLFAENKMSEVPGYLEQALNTADADNDNGSKISILNELIGFNRVTGDFDKSLEYGTQAIELLDGMGMSNTIPYATTLLNVANAHRAAGNYAAALTLYKQIEGIYNSNLSPDDYLIASFNNNIALLYQEMGDFESAVVSLKKALEIIKKFDDGASELATTYTNLGTSLTHTGRFEEAKEMLTKALDTYDSIGEKGYHYSSALSAMGEIYFREGNYDRSLEYYEDAANEIYSVFGENAVYKVVQENIKAVKEQIDKEKQA
ncbi:MAG: tetratricopeptide repeat protein [Coprococcus sp.]